MGSIWEGVGTLWGLSRVLLDASWPFWERSKPSFFQALGQDGLQEAFWLDFWSIWEGLGGVLGGFGEAFGAPLAHLGRPGVELASHLVRMLYVSCCPIYAGVLEPFRVLDGATCVWSTLELIWTVWSCFTHIRAP